MVMPGAGAPRRGDTGAGEGDGVEGRGMGMRLVENEPLVHQTHDIHRWQFGSCNHSKGAERKIKDERQTDVLKQYG